VTSLDQGPRQGALAYGGLVPDAQPVTPPVEPKAPPGQLSRLGLNLVGASDIDEIAASLLSDLAAVPAVHRVGFGLAEVGGRRVRFTASDRLGERVEWCHVDAYDDVPLTAVVRTGEPIMGARGALDSRFDAFMETQPAEVRALATVPLPGIGSPIGALVLYLDQEWSFDEAQVDWLHASARYVADAVRRVRATTEELHEDEPAPSDEGTVTARIVLADDPRAARAGRRFLREFLARAEVPEEIAETAELCLSELVTNAIIHAGGRSELRATVDSAVTVSVRDSGGRMDAVPAADADPLRVDGRGLQLVAALADRWGSERDVIGTSVWFALDLHRESVGVSEQ
jgi:anti-sigma regulatory factor (Ser/Thr protein kinase)